MPKRVLIAPDSFKDALSASDVCAAIAEGLRQTDPTWDIRAFPLADGGEGTYAVLAAHLGLRAVAVEACDPLGRPLRSEYGLSADGQTAFLELAQTAGLPLLKAAERDPRRTTTYGLGQQIADAAQRGVRHLVIAIGGSATNDAGLGVASALGWQLLDAQGQPLAPIGESLLQLARLEPPVNPVRFARVQVMCDVTNPLFGPQGAAHVYAPQKGADADAVARLDAGLRRFAQVAARLQPLDPDAAGSGAAGGVGFGLRLFLSAQLQRGIEVILDLTRFDEALAATDWVITGEGRLDAQTAQGKLIHGICQRAAKHHKPVLALCGQLLADEAALRHLGLQAAFSINPPEMTDLPTLLARTRAHLVATTRETVSPHLLAREVRSLESKGEGDPKC